MIRRTIDKPLDKLNRLVRFIDDNKYWGAIYFKLDDIGCFQRVIVNVPEHIVLDVFNISKRTLDNWVVKYGLEYGKRYPQVYYNFPKEFQYLQISSINFGYPKNRGRQYSLIHLFALVTMHSYDSEQIKIDKF